MTVVLFRKNPVDYLLNEEEFIELLERVSDGDLKTYEKLKEVFNEIIQKISLHTSTLILDKLLERADQLVSMHKFDIATGILESIRQILVDDDIRFRLNMLKSQGL